jgi:predicted metal-dependent hydrolase
MRQFLQLSLDLFSEVVVPLLGSSTVPRIEKKKGKGPLPGTSIDVVATNNVAIEPAQAHQPGEPLDAVLSPSHFAHPQANRQVRLHYQPPKRSGEAEGDCTVAYLFKRARRKTIGFSVDADGLVVSAPRWVPLHEVQQALQEKAGWIVKKLEQSRQRAQQLQAAQVEWKEGAAIAFLGEPVIIVLDPRQATSGLQGFAQLRSDAQTLPGVPAHTLHIGLPQDASRERIRDAVQAWLMRQAKTLFEQRLNHFAPQLGVRWTKLSLSNASSRWGSAGSDGAIRLNWRLIHFRTSVIDYVVVHELSHLRVMDHSPRFWSTVQAVLPDYAQRRGLLRDELLPRF